MVYIVEQLQFTDNLCTEKVIFHSKGQIKPKADWRNIDSVKEKSNELVFLPRKTKKQRSKKKLSVRFLGESTACKSAFGFI